MKSKINILQMVISLLAIILLAVFALAVISKPTDGGEIEEFSLPQGLNTAGAIESGVTVEQTFAANENYLCRLDILLSNYGEPNDSDTTIELFDDKNNCVYSEIVPVYDITANSYRTIAFDMIPNSKGKLFKLVIKCEAVGSTHAMTAWCTEDNAYTDGALLVNGEEAGYDIVFKAYSATSGFSKELSAPVLLCTVISAAVILLYHILLKKYNENYLKLICWALCSIYISLSIIAVYLKVSGTFISCGLFETKSLLKALLILPCVFLICGLFFNDLNRLKDKEYIKTSVSQAWKAMLPALIISGVFCFMLFIYEPILVYSGNISDFSFDIGLMAPALLLFFVIGCLYSGLIFLTIYLVNRMFSKNNNVFCCVVIGFFVVFLATYIQGNWLAGDLPVLMGGQIEWDNYLSNDIITLLVWLILIIAAIAVTVKFKPKNVIKYSSGISVIVLIMLFAGMTSNVVKNNALKSRSGPFVPTMENYNTASSDKNFLVFLVDTIDASTVKQLIDSNEEYQRDFKDFTYFENAMSSYPFTIYSIPNILTGTVDKYENDYVDYCNDSYNNSPLFNELTQNNYDINIYSSDVRWSGAKNYNIKNSSSSYLKLNIQKFFIEELKYVSFKYLPYAYKRYSQIESVDFNSAFDSEIELFSENNRFNNNTIKSTDLTIQSKPVFQFIHTEGAHPGFYLDRDLNEVSSGTSYEQETEGCVTLLRSYIQRLKDNGVYDNSVIILMSDHGYYAPMDEPPSSFWPYPIDGKETLGRFNPLFMVKGMNESHDNYINSDIPISYMTDLQDAYKELIAGYQSTDLFSNIAPTRQRLAYCHLNIVHLEEFSTDGKAWEWEKFKPTGNVYDYNG